MRAWTSWLAFWRRGRRSSEPPAAPAEDPRAGELRRRLEESRAVVEEQHEEAASPETPVDEAPDAPANASVEDRRAAVHERARAASDEMRGE